MGSGTKNLCIKQQICEKRQLLRSSGFNIQKSLPQATDSGSDFSCKRLRGTYSWNYLFKRRKSSSKKFTASIFNLSMLAYIAVGAEVALKILTRGQKK